MYRVKIFGAGSIGNHLAHACRQRGWEVALCDPDPAARERTRKQIYPERYGAWDDEIRLASPGELEAERYDLTIIGTPPDTHMALACDELEKRPPQVLLIEKPVSTPSLEKAEQLIELARKSGTFVAVGYNHTLTRHSRRAAELLAQGVVGRPLTLSAAFREYWGGIFKAHPWLSGPQDSYLGFSARGGGAGGEHSHALNIWQHFARLAGAGRVVEVRALLDYVAEKGVDYDRIFQLHLRTESGLVGTVVQDVVTEPPVKQARIQGEKGFIEWTVNLGPGCDGLRWAANGQAIANETFPKRRPDDFAGEIEHLGRILAGEAAENSPLSLEYGLETMTVVAAAHLSDQLGRPIAIDFGRGPGLKALQPR